MPYTKQELITLYSLQEEEVNQTLKAAELSVDGEPYTDEQIQTGFDAIRNYFNSGQVSDYAAATELFKQHQAQQQLEADVAKTKKSTKGKKPENSNENGVAESEEQLNVVELLARASQQVGTRISLTEAVQIFSACGLPDKEQYSYIECDRFLKACEMQKLQNKSYEEVAAPEGGKNRSRSNLQSQLQEIVAKFSDSATTAESELLELASRIAKQQVDATDIDIDQLMKRLYLMEVSHKAAKRRDKNDTIFAELEQRIMDQIEGKSPLRSLQASWDWQMNSLAPSSPKPMSLPEESDNGTSAS